jgi:ABC-type Fe3+-hydroxamate transport system substrate-binding protein
VELPVTEAKTMTTKAGLLLLGTAVALALAGCSRNTEEQENIAAAHAAAERAEFAAQRAEKAANSAEKANAPVVVEGDPEATEDAEDADKAEAENDKDEDGPVSTEPTTKT